jgi:hypothetical protein
MALVFLGTLFVYSVFKRKHSELEFLVEKYSAERTKLYSVLRKLYYENCELKSRILALEQAANIQYTTVETQVSPSNSFTDSSIDTNSSNKEKRTTWPFNVIT